MGASTPSPYSPEEAQSLRLHLLHHNNAAAVRAFVQATARGHVRPVVWVLDLRERKAVEIAQAWSVDVANARSQAGTAGIPVAIVAMPQLAGADLAGAMTENGREMVVDFVPLGSFAVVVVAAGGNHYAHLPCPVK